MDEREDYIETKTKLSAAKFVDVTGYRNRMFPVPEQPYPEVGSYIVYNQIEKVHIHDGRPQKTERGVAKIISYSPSLVLLKVYERPEFSRKTCFTLNEIRLGLVRYKTLTDYVYSCNYTYDELNLSHLHEDILKLLK